MAKRGVRTKLTEQEILVYTLRQAEPDRTWVSIAKESGIPGGSVRGLYNSACALLADLRARNTSPLEARAQATRDTAFSQEDSPEEAPPRQPPLPSLNGVRAEELRNLTGINAQRLLEILNSKSDDEIRQESVRNLAVGAAVLIDKRQLLFGEPTQITRLEDREKLEALIPMLLKEAKRRGIETDYDPMQGIHIVNEGHAGRSARWEETKHVRIERLQAEIPVAEKS